MATVSEKTPAAISATVNGTVITIQASNGRYFTIDAEQLSPENRLAAIMQGLRKKLVDPAAMSRNPDTGASATIDDKFEACEEVGLRIKNGGDWNKVRGDGTGPVKGGMLLRALIAIFGKTEEETRALLDECSDDEVKALRDSPKVQAKIAEFKRANSKIDVDALMAAKFGA